MMAVPETSIHTVKRKLDSGEKVVLVDVREAEELENGALPGIVHIPMGDIMDRIGELDPSAETVIVCRTGNRSRKVAEYLAGQGFSNVANLTEGMNGWAEAIGDGYRVY